MTEPTNNRVDESDVERPPYTTGDPQLALLVASLSRTEADITVTLCASGAVVTGRLVGVNRWWREMTEAYAEGLGELAEVLREGALLPPDPENADDDPVRTWAHIHLVDARYISSGGSMPVEGMYWRGRLSEVAGWSFGVMSVGEA